MPTKKKNTKKKYAPNKQSAAKTTPKKKVPAKNPVSSTPPPRVPPAKVGRPTKITKELTDEICKHIEAGNYIEVASAIVGLNKETFYAWLKRGAREAEAIHKGKDPNPDEEIFLEFSNAILKAEAIAESIDVMRLRIASQKNPAWAAWRLERKHGERWNKKEIITGEGGTPLVPPSSLVVNLVKRNGGGEVVTELIKNAGKARKESDEKSPAKSPNGGRIGQH